MTGKEDEEVWAFHFFLEQDGNPVPYSEAEALIDQIIAWVEERELQIGGGFHAATIEDAPLVPQRLLVPGPFREN
jgi:hypothetical protein